MALAVDPPSHRVELLERCHGLAHLDGVETRGRSAGGDLHAAAGVWISVLMNSSFDAMTMASFFNCLFAASNASCNSFWCATADSFSALTFSRTSATRRRRRPA